MKCKYFKLTVRCMSCPVLNDEKRSKNTNSKIVTTECPKPEPQHFKAAEWWAENRKDDMISYFDKLEVKHDGLADK